MRISRRGSPPADQHGPEPTGAPDVAPSFDTSRLPIDRATGRAIPPRAQPGYYPGWHVLGQQAFWDEATRRVVLARVADAPPIRFFRRPDELRLAEAVFDRILPQDDRDAAHRVPIVATVDRKLHDREIPGCRFEGMPDEQVAYRLGLRGIDAIARHLFDRPFADLEPLGQDQVLETLHDGVPPSGAEIWQRVDVRHFWLLLVEHAAEAYYSHPYAWDEIGYGGPAYPRGYMRLTRGEPEPWEVRERRYEWAAPPASLSGAFTPVGGKMPLDEQLRSNAPSPTAGGTH